MSNPVFVTAIYRIYGEERPEYCDEVWTWFAFLARHLPVIHIFCSLADASRLASIPNVIPHFVEFMDLDTYRALVDAPGLPDNRNTMKDSKEFMILANAKAEFLRRTQVLTQTSTASHYIWIDAGIQKILHVAPSEVLTRLVTRCGALRTDKILIPGLNWNRYSLTAEDVGREVLWRFCGGFCVVPANLVNHFSHETLAGAQEILRATGKLTWEGNVWAYMESRLPIRWYGCGWNESIFEFPTD